MKKIVVLMAMALLFVMAGTSNASLIADGGYVYDDVAEIWWYQDLSTFVISGNTYSAQVTYISVMSVDCQLADETQISGLWSNGGTAIAESFLPSASWGYWGRTDIVNLTSGTGHSVGYINLDGTDGGYDIFQDDESTGDHIGAWVYTTTNPVPIPSAIWLLGSAFIGLVGCRRKFRR